MNACHTESFLYDWQRYFHDYNFSDDNMIEMFLVTNKFSIERTKERLDMYYTIRSLIPEIYEHSNPLQSPMVDVPKNMW